MPDDIVKDRGKIVLGNLSFAVRTYPFKREREFVEHNPWFIDERDTHSLEYSE